MTKRKRTSVPGIPPDQAKLERIAAAIRERPHDYARNNALTAALTPGQHAEVARLIDAAAEAEQDAKEQREIAERQRRRYGSSPRQNRQPDGARPQYQLSRAVSLTAAVMMFALLAVGWRAAVLVLVVVLLGRFYWWLCQRHPFVAIFVVGFLRGLLTGRR